VIQSPIFLSCGICGWKKKGKVKLPKFRIDQKRVEASRPLSAVLARFLICKMVYGKIFLLLESYVIYVDGSAVGIRWFFRDPYEATHNVTQIFPIQIDSVLMPLWRKRDRAA
jgi:hypothetical protein